MNRDEMLNLAGIPLTALADGVALPAEAPPAPWHTSMRAVVWQARPNGAARQAAGSVHGRPALVLGALISYDETPVGPYDEIVGGVGLLSGKGFAATVPFIAVDSPASVVGGRVNWALPKTLARFTGTPPTGMTATGEGWSVRVTVRAPGFAVPFRTRGQLRQPWPGGGVRRTRVGMSGRARPALVHVRVEAEPALSGWLRGGWHLGAVLENVTGHFGPAT
ncbi:acetoacetate decarboxylase family protein [Actinophytocola sp.]|uniref:acetoacetate decarboxylase family protein n=1 Tax=Actinophytocola sp. TaxID=1872138 RepID=UPI003899E3AD